MFSRDFPRIAELALLRAGFGARLLTRTRVPILKVCECPSRELYSALMEEREKWDELPGDQKHAPQDTHDNSGGNGRAF